MFHACQSAHERSHNCETCATRNTAGLSLCAYLHTTKGLSLGSSERFPSFSARAFIFTPCSWDLVVVTSAAVSSRDVQCLHRWKRRRARTATVLQRATRIEIARVGFQEPDLVKHTRTKIRIRLLLYEKATCKHLLRVQRAESDSGDSTTTQCHNAMMDAPSLGLYA